MGRKTIGVPAAARALYRMTAWALLGLLVSQAPLAMAQQELTSDLAQDPAGAEFVFADVENFVQAHDAILSGMNPAQALQTQYFDRASPGLRMFIEKYDLTMERMLDAIERHPAAYDRTRELLRALRDREPYFRSSYAAIERVIPSAVFPPTYFLVSAHRGIGSGSVEGPLISIEKETVGSIEQGGVEPTLVHEMIHIQQLASVGEEYFAIFSGEERTLLALSIREGAATFFAELITGGSEHKNKARDYYLAREDELWEEFRADMLGHDIGEWLWEKPADPEKPQDLGYAIGARIVEAYYENASDKGAAAREIMSVTDYPAFLARSGYLEGR